MPKYSLKKFSLNDKQVERKNRTLSLVLTSNCNLRCRYCYEKHNNRDEKIMDFNVAREAIERFMTAEDEFDTVIVDLFGGEPLLAYPLIKEVVEWLKTQEWKKRYLISIPTNGTLLNEEMKAWFLLNKDQVIPGLSIDGNRTAHNINRDNSYDLVYPHLGFFKENWPYQPLKLTISSETIPYVAESIIELEEMGIFFTANIAFEDFWGTPENKSKLLEIYKEQLARLVAYYVENPKLYPVYPMLGIMPDYLGVPGIKVNNDNDCVRFCGAGHEMVVIDTDGRQYPCHRFLPWVSGKPAPTYQINRQTSWEPEKCAKCKIIHSCPTCAGFNWEQNNDTSIRTTYHCEAHKLEVLAAAQISTHRLKTVALSHIESMSPQERTLLNDRVKALMNLDEEGI